MKKLAILLLLFLNACALPEPKKIATPFDEAEMIEATKLGTGSITGSAFAKTMGGEVKSGAGSTVYLYPVTPYVMEFVTLNEKYNRVITDPRLKNYIKSTVADAAGNFEFENLKAGRYYLETRISWRFFNGYNSQETGGVAKNFVQVEENKKSKVILNP